MLVLAHSNIHLADTEFDTEHRGGARENENACARLATMSLFLWEEVYHFLKARQTLSGCDWNE